MYGRERERGRRGRGEGEGEGRAKSVYLFFIKSSKSRNICCLKSFSEVAGIQNRTEDMKKYTVIY